MLHNVNQVSLLDDFLVNRNVPSLGYIALHIGIYKGGCYENVCDWRKVLITIAVPMLSLSVTGSILSPQEQKHQNLPYILGITWGFMKPQGFHPSLDKNMQIHRQTVGNIFIWMVSLCIIFFDSSVILLAHRSHILHILLIQIIWLKYSSVKISSKIYLCGPNVIQCPTAGEGRREDDAPCPHHVESTRGGGVTRGGGSTMRGEMCK
jgi:hypothetical protein